ncbi:hypothetical protein Scep_006602 [Stephania cephalantha]|uniref:Uncharacterized protein n=1 Tax=Stephania cephalantha TaxID=152367 RepID=A0AAP0K9I0_9MAGN
MSHAWNTRGCERAEGETTYGVHEEQTRGVCQCKACNLRDYFERVGNAVFSKDLYDVVGGKGDVVGFEFLIRKLLVIGSTPNLPIYYQFLDRFDPQGLRKEAFARLQKVDKL